MQSRWKGTVKPVPCGKPRWSVFFFSLQYERVPHGTRSTRPSGDRALIQAVSRMSYRGGRSSNPEPVHVRYEVDEVALVQAFPSHYHSTDVPCYLHLTVIRSTR